MTLDVVIVRTPSAFRAFSVPKAASARVRATYTFEAAQENGKPTHDPLSSEAASIDMQDNADECPHTTFAVTHIACQSVSEYARSVALLTHEPLDVRGKPLPSVELHYVGEQKLAKVNAIGMMTLSREQYIAACTYTLRVLAFLNFQETSEDVEQLLYLILPLTRCVFDEAQIDWPEIQSSIERPQLISLEKSGLMSTATSESLGALEDRTILEGLSFAERPLCSLRVRTDVSMNDAFAEAEDGTTLKIANINASKFKKVDKESIDRQQALLEVYSVPKMDDYLPGSKLNGQQKDERKLSGQHYIVIPSVCQVGPMSVSMLRACRMFPSIVVQLSRVLVARQLNLHLLDEAITDENYLLRALTLSKSRPYASYEPLEFFGDCVLKLFATCFVYLRHATFAEGKLTNERSACVANAHLTNIAHTALVQGRWTIAQHVFAERPIGKHWLLEFSDGEQQCTAVPLSSKAHADLVEALLGAAWLSDLKANKSHELTRVVTCMNKLSIFGEEISLDHFRLHCLRQYMTTTDDDEHAALWPGLTDLQQCLGYTFQRPSLALQAVTHSSVVEGDIARSYERLEFLGDAVLDYCLSKWLAENFPNRSQGEYSKTLHDATCHETLAAMCIARGLHVFLRHNIHKLADQFSELEPKLDSFRTQGVSTLDQLPTSFSSMGIKLPGVLSDMVESLMGAVFIDSQLDFHQTGLALHNVLGEFLERHIRPRLVSTTLTA